MSFRLPLERDKQLHIGVGAAILVSIWAVAALGLHLPLPQAVFLARSAVLVAAIGKEVWDSFQPNHTPDAMDTAATVLGGECVAWAIEATLLLRSES